MKNYRLDLHYKQGDDLAHFIQKAKGDKSAAFSAWAKHFARCQAACAQLSKVLAAHPKVSIDADTHMIAITSENADSTRALNALVKEGILANDTE